MSIPYSGTLSRSAGLSSALTKQINSLTLKPTKKILIKFDPFHSKVASAREFLFHISTPKIIDTNLNCTIKTEVLCDRSDPTVEVLLVNGDKVDFKCANLSTLELLQLYNKHVTPLAPVEEVAAPIKTKASRTAATRKR